MDFAKRRSSQTARATAPGNRTCRFVADRNDDFRGRLILAIEASNLSMLRPPLPESLIQHSADLYLLETAGNALLQMISTLRASNRQMDEMELFPRTDAHVIR